MGVTDRRHRGVTLDDFQRHLLMLLDGTRSRAELLEAMVIKVHSRAILLHSDGRWVNTKEAARPVIERFLAPDLESLARLGVLVE